MSKFYGAIGYSVTEEIRPGVWGEKITVRDYYGDVIRNTRQYQSSDNLCLCDFSFDEIYRLYGV